MDHRFGKNDGPDWNAIVSNGGAESACGWCKDRWGISWQITPRVLIDAMATGGDEAKRVFAAMMDIGKSTSLKSRQHVVGCAQPGEYLSLIGNASSSQVTPAKG